MLESTIRNILQFEARGLRGVIFERAARAQVLHKSCFSFARFAPRDGGGGYKGLGPTRLPPKEMHT